MRFALEDEPGRGVGVKHSLGAKLGHQTLDASGCASSLSALSATTHAMSNGRDRLRFTGHEIVPVDWLREDSLPVLHLDAVSKRRGNRCFCNDFSFPAASCHVTRRINWNTASTNQEA